MTRHPMMADGPAPVLPDLGIPTPRALLTELRELLASARGVDDLQHGQLNVIETTEAEVDGLWARLDQLLRQPDTITNNGGESGAGGIPRRDPQGGAP